MQVLRLYIVLKVILYYKINSYCNEALYIILKQKLIFKEEKSFKNYIFKI